MNAARSSSLVLKIGLIEKLRRSGQSRADSALVAGNNGLPPSEARCGGEDRKFVGSACGLGSAEEKAFHCYSGSVAGSTRTDIDRHSLFELIHRDTPAIDRPETLSSSASSSDQIKALRERKLPGISLNNVPAPLRPRTTFAA